MKIELSILKYWSIITIIIYALFTAIFKEYNYILGLTILASILLAIRFFIIKNTNKETTIKIFSSIFFILLIVPPEMYKVSIIREMSIRWLYDFICVFSIMLVSGLLIKIKSSNKIFEQKIVYFSLVIYLSLYELSLISNGDIVYLIINILKVLIFIVAILSYFLASKTSKEEKFFKIFYTSIVFLLFYKLDSIINLYSVIHLYYIPIWLELAAYIFKYWFILVFLIMSSDVIIKTLKIKNMHK